MRESVWVLSRWLNELQVHHTQLHELQRAVVLDMARSNEQVLKEKELGEVR